MKRVMLPKWHEDLIRCPSQCYCYFNTLDKGMFCIYLRWRHDDPWTAQLVPVDANGQFIDYGSWQYLDVPDYVHDGYNNLEKFCVRLIDSMFDGVIWMEKK